MATRTLIALAAAWGAGCGGPSDAPVDGSLPDAAGSDAPLGVWTWLDVPGAICANGTPTGVGINRGSGERVVVYMSGGSACLDEGCSIGTPSMRKDGGFGAAEMQACAAGDCDGGVTFPARSIFSRTAAANPFADATFVFVSNCAGDYYVGDNEHAFGGRTAQFRGSRNQRLFAGALAAAFPAATRVVLTGGSAGSVGALLNYWQWRRAFADTRVDLVSDSFALVFDDGPEWRYALHAPQLPPDCATCAADYRTVHDYNSGIAGDARIAVLDSEDNVTLDLATLFRYTQGLEDLQPRLAALPNTRYFVASGDEHILFQHELDSPEVDAVDAAGETHLLATFLAQMQGDDPAWQSHSSLGPVP